MVYMATLLKIQVLWDIMLLSTGDVSKVHSASIFRVKQSSGLVVSLVQVFPELAATLGRHNKYKQGVPNATYKTLLPRCTDT